MDNTSKQDPKDLLLMALQQRIGEMVSDYEGRVASLRVAVTMLTNENEELKNVLASKQDSATNTEN